MSLPAEPSIAVRVRFAHAVVQHLADREGIDVLHVKGPALSPEVVAVRGGGTDADVWARATDVDRLAQSLLEHGWTRITSFQTGSMFEHAATFHNGTFGCVDVHRSFPGLEASDAFDRLWRRRVSREIAGVPCACLDPVGEALVLAVHAARSNGRPRDMDLVWHSQPGDVRQRIRELASELDAEVALAAAIGELDCYRDDPAYDIWRIQLHPESRLESLRVRMRKAPTVRSKARVLARYLVPNFRYEELRTGRHLGRRGRLEVLARHYRRLIRRLALEILKMRSFSR